MRTPIQILAISGSLRSTSTNTQLLKAMTAMAPPDVYIQISDDPGKLPHFSPELDNDASPETVKTFRKRLAEADAVIICTPEYAFGVPGVLKNALDWIVSSAELMHKPVAAISASPLSTGGNQAHASLLLTLGALTAAIPDEAKVMIPVVKKKLNEAGELTDAPTAAILLAALNSLITLAKEKKQMKERT